MYHGSKQGMTSRPFCKGPDASCSSPKKKAGHNSSLSTYHLQYQQSCIRNINSSPCSLLMCLEEDHPALLTPRRHHQIRSHEHQPSERQAELRGHSQASVQHWQLLVRKQCTKSISLGPASSEPTAALWSSCLSPAPAEILAAWPSIPCS